MSSRQNVVLETFTVVGTDAQVLSEDRFFRRRREKTHS